DDFPGTGADETSDPLTGLFDRLLRPPAEDVLAAGGVAIVLREIREHRLDNARIGPRRRMVVHVNGKLDHALHLGLTPRRLAVCSFIVVFPGPGLQTPFAKRVRLQQKYPKEQRSTPQLRRITLA